MTKLLIILAFLFILGVTLSFMFIYKNSQLETEYYRDQMLNVCAMANSEADLVDVLEYNCGIQMNESLKLNCTNLILHG